MKVRKQSILITFDKHSKELGWDASTENQILKHLIREAEYFGPGVLEQRLDDFYNAEKEMITIVEGVKKAEKDIDQQDEGWYNAEEEKSHYGSVDSGLDI